MAGELPLNGENVAVTVFVGSKKYGDDKMNSFQVREKTTKHEDQYLNRQRASHDKQVDGYKATFNVDIADNGLFQALLDQQAQRDALLPIDPISIAFALKTRDGAAPKAYVLVNIVTETKLDVSSRNKRVTVDVDCDADDLKAVVV